VYPSCTSTAGPYCTPLEAGAATTSCSTRSGNENVAMSVPVHSKSNGSGPVFTYPWRNTRSTSPSTTPCWGQYQVEPSVGTISVVGSSCVPPCSVSTSEAPSWITIELLMNGESSGRDPSELTRPRNPSDQIHAIRPSGSVTEYEPSAPVQSSSSVLS